MTSTKDASGSWAVRTGTLLDVNAVARLLRSSVRPIDIDGDGIPDGPIDSEAADTAARLVLLHTVLERGQLWVADRGGVPVAAAIWVPGDVEPGSSDLGSILRRELKVDSVDDVAALVGPDEHVRPFLEEAMAGALGAVAPDSLVLYGLVVDPALIDDVDVVALASELVAPVLTETENDSALFALALDAARASLLEAAGFRHVEAVPFGAGHTVWVGRAERRVPLPA
ncbi:hypothetical protein [Salana multivorans]